MPVAERFKGANVIDAGRLSPYWGEHAARYVFASSYVNGKAVLDIACGTGFGLGLMKELATSVVGVDVDPDAAKDARAECCGNTFVLLSDGLSLPFADGSFDIVTSFETIEHLHGRREFLAELHRVLKDAGTLMISTPNANYTMPVNGKPTNPFHIHEYTPDELIQELADQFSIETFLGQSLRSDFGIPPFRDAQLRLPRDLGTRARLVGWKMLNKLPLKVRETASGVLWKRPFYPQSSDYEFDEASASSAPVLVAICRK